MSLHRLQACNMRSLDSIFKMLHATAALKCNAAACKLKLHTSEQHNATLHYLSTAVQSQPTACRSSAQSASTSSRYVTPMYRPKEKQCSKTTKYCRLTTPKLHRLQCARCMLNSQTRCCNSVAKTSRSWCLLAPGTSCCKAP